jgi:hypothetical protein
MTFVVENAGQRIMENSTGFVETHAVLLQVVGGLMFVPLEAKAHGFLFLLYDLPIGIISRIDKYHQ